MSAKLKIKLSGVGAVVEVYDFSIAAYRYYIAGLDRGKLIGIEIGRRCA